MELQSRSIPPAVILDLTGRFDSHVAPAVREWLEKTVAANSTLILINLTGVTFVDSTALAALVYAMKRTRERSGDIYLCGLQSPVRLIFQLTRLDRAFEIFADEQGALQAFSARETH
jgi:anti-sigma B factor antagonist